MVSKAKWSTKAKHYSKKIFDCLNTITINDGLWRETNKYVITHWCEQLHLYEEYSDQLSLTDTVKISLLQKAVSSPPHLKVVKMQTVCCLGSLIELVRLILQGITNSLSLWPRTSYNAKNGSMMHSQNRRANTHMLSDSEYDDTNEPNGIYMDIYTILINAARTQASHIPCEHWNQIFINGRTIWRQIPNEDHTIILEGCPNDTVSSLMGAIEILSLVHDRTSMSKVHFGNQANDQMATTESTGGTSHLT